MNLDFLVNFFGPPEFLKMPFVAFDISNHFVRFVELKKRGGSFVLGKVGEKKIPEGIFSSGDILKKTELISILSDIKKENGFNLVKVSIPEEKSYIFITEVPKVEHKEIRQMIEFCLEENVPLKLEEAVFEYSIIEQSETSNLLKINVSVIQKQTVDSFLDVFQSAGFLPLSLKTESKAVVRCILPPEIMGNVLIINIKDTSTILSMTINGVVWFTSTISIGKNFVIDILKKNSITNQQSIYKISEDIFSSDEAKNAEVFDSLMNVFSILRDDVKKFIEFWENKCGKISQPICKIDKVVLCGSVSAIPGFARYMSSSLGLQVEVANVWVNIFNIENIVPSVKFVDSLDFGPVLGVALGDIDKI
ncbi:MAG: pilus assembly protein PilM [Minisyncoccia bacterium]